MNIVAFGGKLYQLDVFYHFSPTSLSLDSWLSTGISLPFIHNNSALIFSHFLNIAKVLSTCDDSWVHIPIKLNDPCILF